ncbi:MAG: MBL fold metallo-hydrolase [Candidatus Marinimicrobia bacterium]|nr:MBL fold metallo-hydrolase [Candidatus Neomarinimicrobiota bacterium]
MMKRLAQIFAALILLIFSIPGNSTEQVEPISLRYLGHSAFLITTSSGTRILTDPVEFKGYTMPPGIEADIVTISHEHIDHNNTSSLAPDFTSLSGCHPGNQKISCIDTTLNDVQIFNVASYHGPGHHGFNSIFILEIEGIRIAHLGDIGTVLSEEQILEIGSIDILLIPVGGKFTIPLDVADSIVSQLCDGSIIIPMHYRTEEFVSLPHSAEDFLQGKDNVVRTHQTTIMISPLSIDEKNMYYKMEYKD